jgi:TolA-binding protein
LATAAGAEVGTRGGDPVRGRFEEPEQAGAGVIFSDFGDADFGGFAGQSERDEDDELLMAGDALAAEREIGDVYDEGIVQAQRHSWSRFHRWQLRRPGATGKSKKPNGLNGGAGPVTVLGAMWWIRMGLTIGWLAGSLAALAAAEPASLATEAKAFEVAARLFEDQAFDLAEREFAEFLRANPGSPRAAEALLLQAQAQFAQGRPEESLALLRSGLETAGEWADRYGYWMAESLYQLGRNEEAARGFAAVLADFPNSSRRLEASLGEAYATFKLGDLRRTLGVIRNWWRGVNCCWRRCVSSWAITWVGSTLWRGYRSRACRRS